MLDELEFFEFMLTPPYKLLANQNFIKTKAKEIPNNLGKEISIVGQLVTTKYAKTKHNQTMYFGTFLDIDGAWIDTVLFPDIAAKYQFKGYGCYHIKGKVTKEFNFYSIEVTYLEKLSWWNASENE
jgi:DNA polymerase-3 subunit alpha